MTKKPKPGTGMMVHLSRDHRELAASLTEKLFEVYGKPSGARHGPQFAIGFALEHMDRLVRQEAAIMDKPTQEYVSALLQLAAGDRQAAEAYRSAARTERQATELARKDAKHYRDAADHFQEAMAYTRGHNLALDAVLAILAEYLALAVLAGGVADPAEVDRSDVEQMKARIVGKSPAWSMTRCRRRRRAKPTLHPLIFSTRYSRPSSRRASAWR